MTHSQARAQISPLPSPAEQPNSDPGEYLVAGTRQHSQTAGPQAAAFCRDRSWGFRRPAITIFLCVKKGNHGQEVERDLPMVTQGAVL